MTAETIAATNPQHTPPVSPTEPAEAGKGGEAGDFQITNAEFIAAVFTDLPEGAFAAVCSKSGDPSLGGWLASRADKVPTSLQLRITTTSAVQVFIPVMMVRSRRGKPNFPHVTS
jgi:hypothetical protein